MNRFYCSICDYASRGDELLCSNCGAKGLEEVIGSEPTGDLDKEMLISALRHAAMSKDIVIQRLMFNLVEKEDKIIELQDRIERFLEDRD